MNCKELTGGESAFLDYYRCVGAFLVLFGHSFSFYGMTIFRNQKYFPSLQNIGVVMLFLLSGFLTTYSINYKDITNNYSFKKFAKHKIDRIMREYIPGLLIIASIDGIAIFFEHIGFFSFRGGYRFYNAYNLKQFIGNCFLLQNTAINLFSPRLNFIPFGSGRPLWTLSMGMYFYFLFSTIYFILKRKRMNYFLFVFLLMPMNFIIGPGGKSIGFIFLMGVFSYYFIGCFDKKIALWLMPLSIVGYILYGIVFKDAYTYLSYIILWIIFCSGLKIFSSLQVSRKKYIIFVSRSTFMLYLIHYSVIELIYGLNIQFGHRFRFLTGILLSCLLSCILFYCFGEKKLLTLIFCYMKETLNRKKH